MLDPECGIPMRQFEGKLDFYGGPEHRGGFQGVSANESKSL
jgi:hypothetical protein